MIERKRDTSQPSSSENDDDDNNNNDNNDDTDDDDVEGKTYTSSFASSFTSREACDEFSRQDATT